MLQKKHLIILLLLGLFLYTRFVGLDWGLPYPMHPDERNMSAALQDLDCPRGSTIQECFNPHFFAYGQFPLYLGYGLVKGWHLIKGITSAPISFIEATLALRFIAAMASLLNLYFLVRIVHVVREKKHIDVASTVVTMLLFTFTPYAVQFSHFGTTESLLMALYTGIVYYSLRMIESRKSDRALYLAALLTGIAIASKVSSILFMTMPVIAIINAKDNAKVLSVGMFLIFSAMAAAYFSPHNLISYGEFRSALTYELGIGQGTIVAFYNRQFDHTIPVLFHITRIFPYVLGLVQLVLFLAGMLFLPYNKKFNVLRISFFFFFLPSAFLYAKWTRFIAPVMPIMTVFVAVGFLSIVQKLRIKVLYLGLILLILPGIAYVSIYTTDDVRFKASEWIKTHMPDGSKVLSETANVVDVPLVYKPGMTMPNYDIASFDLYHIDSDESLAESLKRLTSVADYIFIPSRRIYANNTCYRFMDGTVYNTGRTMLLQGYTKDTCQHLSATYPLINDYYDKLFTGQLPFIKVAEITSYPRISLFGKTLYEIRDENAEETWTVFDHPVIRIYKRI